MFLPVFPGNPPANGHRTAFRHQDPGKDLDRGGLSRAIRPDIAYQFPFFNLKADILQCVNGLFFTQQSSLLTLFADNKRLTEMVDKNIAHDKSSGFFIPYLIGRYFAADYPEFFCMNPELSIRR